MARHPHSTRRIPIALPAAEVRLTPPLARSRGGDGWSGAIANVTAAASATDFTLGVAFLFSGFEAAARTTEDRLNGLRLKTQGRVVTITNHTAAGAVTVSPALPATPAVGDLVKIEADIPLYVSALWITAPSVELRYNLEDTNGLITAGQYMPIAAGLTHTLLNSDEVNGSPGFPVHIASGGAATIAEVVIYVP